MTTSEAGAAPVTTGSPAGAPPPSDPSSPEPVLELAAPLATLALVALFTGRVLAPAVKGVGVGMGGVVGTLNLLGDVSSQVFAFAAMMGAIVTILAASRSRLPVTQRIAALTLGGFSVLPTVWALHQALPDLTAALVGAGASLLAVIVAASAMGAPFTRAPGVVIGLVGLGELLRLAAVGVALRGSAWHLANVASLAGGISAAAFLGEAAAVAIALAWVSSRFRRRSEGLPWSPATIVVLALALLLTRQALAGQASDAHGFDLFCWRAAGRLVEHPDAALPLGFRIFVAFLAPLVAVGALLSGSQASPRLPLGAGVALALAARGAVEMPPCALMLIIGALAVALTAGDGPALWASLGRK